MSKSPLLSKLGFCPLNEGKRMREFASFLCLLDWNILRKFSLNIVPRIVGISQDSIPSVIQIMGRMSAILYGPDFFALVLSALLKSHLYDFKNCIF